jgi:CBS domain containing-hemolysin-like protein
VELGEIPTGGESVRRHDLEVKFETVRHRRIARLRVSRSGDAGRPDDSASD